MDKDTGRRDLIIELISIGSISLLSIYLASITGFINTVLLFFSGFIAFGLLEYCIHRFAFHLKTGKEPLKKWVYKIHGIHHHHPSDQRFYKTPVYLKISVVLVINVLGYITGGGTGLVFSSGIGCGYAFYLAVHFVVHHYSPPGNRFKFFWLYHEIHHHIDQKKAFGVSNPIWDFVFNTYPGKKDFGRADKILKN